MNVADSQITYISVAFRDGASHSNKRFEYRQHNKYLNNNVLINIAKDGRNIAKDKLNTIRDMTG
jgi:hypothetical protein